MARIEIVMATLRCGAQICLARRSQLVATSRGMWSVVTGYLEAGVEPVAQAYTELEEELGLGAPRIRLVARLEPVPLNSPASAKQFLVHPFLFECDSSQELVLNWENDDVQWAEPSRLESPDCVGWQLPLVRALLDLTAEGSRSNP